MKPTISPNEVVVCDGQRAMGSLIPRQGAIEVHAADGHAVGKFPTVATARAALIAYDKNRVRQ